MKADWWCCQWKKACLWFQSFPPTVRFMMTSEINFVIKDIVAELKALLAAQCSQLSRGSWSKSALAKLSSHLQSGAGHQRVSGSDARKRLSWYSSNLSSNARSSSMARTSRGASVSGHCGQAMPTRLSDISIRRYWRRQSEHALWEQEVSRGKWQRGWLSRHSGHSSRCSSNSWSWLEEERDRTPVEPLLTPPTNSTAAALFSPTAAAAAAAGGPPPSPFSAPETLDSPASSAVRS